MKTKVYTVIKNNSSTVFNFNVSSRKRYKIRAGQTLTIPCDIWSTMGITDTRRIERSMEKGVLTVTTKLDAGNSIFVTTKYAGDVAIDKAPETEYEYSLPPENEVKIKHKEKAGAKALEKLTGLGGSNKVAVASAKVMQAFGAKIDEEDNINKKMLKHEEGDDNFKALTKGTTNVFKKSERNIEQVNAVGLWNNGTAIMDEKPHPADLPDEPMNEEEQINFWITTECWDAVTKWVKDNFPAVKVSKTNIKKCQTYADLIQLIDNSKA